MDTMDISKELRKYAEGVGSEEKTLALVAARWIAVEPTAAEDPLLAPLLERMKRALSPSHISPLLMCGRPSIADYFRLTPELPTQTSTPSERLRIYCDGACRANGRRGAAAGFGGLVVHPTKGEGVSVSRPLGPSEPQTNQRAELRALEWAFAQAMASSGGADIHTDSEYALKCFTEWGPLWAAKGWRKATGGEVLHQDILKPMWDIWKSRGTKIRLFHVSAHTGGRDIHSVGNARADALAVASIA
jgi:ribonuclease HI